MKYPEIIISLDDEVESFIDMQSTDQDIVEVEVITKFMNNIEASETVDVILGEFGIHFLESLVEVFINDGVLDTDIPAKGKRNLEKRKGVKYILDHIKAIIQEAKGDQPW